MHFCGRTCFAEHALSTGLAPDCQAAPEGRCCCCCCCCCCCVALCAGSVDLQARCVTCCCSGWVAGVRQGAENVAGLFCNVDAACTAQATPEHQVLYVLVAGACTITRTVRSNKT
jgi:hypothetical protein